MRNKILYKKGLVLFVFFITCFTASFAGTTTVKDIVKDAATKQPLQSVSVVLNGAKALQRGLTAVLLCCVQVQMTLN